MKVLIIGLGSIAQKHINALKKLQPDCEILALRSGKSRCEIEGVKNVYQWDQVPHNLDFVMICNPTSEHYKTIKKSLEVGVPLFIEKPPLMNLEGVTELLSQTEQKNIRTYTAFNFRFHPVIQWLSNNLSEKRVLEVQAYCGSFLPNWRPGRDYRKVYSAKRELGGGVHLDLIHELDYITWLFGEPFQLNSFRSKVSDLQINSIDTAHYWLQYENYNISVLLNYYRRDARRYMEIVMEDETWMADLLASQVIKANGQVIFSDSCNLTDTYYEQMKYFVAGLNKQENYMNHLGESIRTLSYCLQ